MRAIERLRHLGARLIGAVAGWLPLPPEERPMAEDPPSGDEDADHWRRRLRFMTLEKRGRGGPR